MKKLRIFQLLNIYGFEEPGTWKNALGTILYQLRRQLFLSDNVGSEQVLQELLKYSNKPYYVQLYNAFDEYLKIINTENFQGKMDAPKTTPTPKEKSIPTAKHARPKNNMKPKQIIKDDVCVACESNDLKELKTLLTKRDYKYDFDCFYQKEKNEPNEVAQFSSPLKAAIRHNNLEMVLCIVETEQKAITDIYRSKTYRREMCIFPDLYHCDQNLFDIVTAKFCLIEKVKPYTAQATIKTNIIEAALSSFLAFDKEMQQQCLPRLLAIMSSLKNVDKLILNTNLVQRFKALYPHYIQESGLLISSNNLIASSNNDNNQNVVQIANVPLPLNVGQKRAAFDIWNSSEHTESDRVENKKQKVLEQQQNEIENSNEEIDFEFQSIIGNWINS